MAVPVSRLEAALSGELFDHEKIEVFKISRVSRREGHVANAKQMCSNESVAEGRSPAHQVRGLDHESVKAARLVIQEGQSHDAVISEPLLVGLKILVLESESSEKPLRRGRFRKSLAGRAGPESKAVLRWKRDPGSHQ